MCPSCLLVTNILVYGYTTSCLSMCLLMDSWVVRLYLLAIANNAAVNTGIQKSVRASVFSSFRYIPRSGIAWSYGNSVFKFVVLAALGLCCGAQAVPCCAQAFPGCGEQGLLLVVVGGLLTVAASLVAEHRLQGAWALVIVMRVWA